MEIDRILVKPGDLVITRFDSDVMLTQNMYTSNLKHTMMRKGDVALVIEVYHLRGRGSHGEGFYDGVQVLFKDEIWDVRTEKLQVVQRD